MKIPAPYRAFSHVPGVKVMVPETLFTVRGYPTALEIAPLDKEPVSFLELGLTGPIFPFTVELDLKRKRVLIYGKGKEGYFRFSVQREEKELILKMEKAPKAGISYKDTLKKKKGTLFSGDKVKVAEVTPPLNKPYEELFLGSNKAREFELIRKRKDLKEILPLWHGLGQMTPSVKEEKPLPSDLLKVYLSYFSSGFVPRGHDEEHQGLFPPLGKSAPYVLSRGAFLIRSLFFKEEKGIYYILPDRPSKLDCGKMVSIVTEDETVIDLEWTKHQVRTVQVKAKKEKELFFIFPKEIKKFRLKTSPRDKGRSIKAGEGIPIQVGKTIYLDRFQK